MLKLSYSFPKKKKEDLAERWQITIPCKILCFTDVVPILTTAVIECTKAGLKQSAFKFAVELLKDCNRKSINEKYRKKIEAIVR